LSRDGWEQMLKLSSFSSSVDASGDTRDKKGIWASHSEALGYDVKPARLEGAGCDGAPGAVRQIIST
jgi:hypothetical protein